MDRVGSARLYTPAHPRDSHAKAAPCLRRRHLKRHRCGIKPVTGSILFTQLPFALSLSKRRSAVAPVRQAHHKR